MVKKKINMLELKEKAVNEKKKQVLQICVMILQCKKLIKRFVVALVILV